MLVRFCLLVSIVFISTSWICKFFPAVHPEILAVFRMGSAWTICCSAQARPSGCFRFSWVYTGFTVPRPWSGPCPVKNALLKFVSETQQSILLIIGLKSNLQATCPFWLEWTIGWKELLSFCYQISCGKSKSCDFPRAFLPQVSRIFYSHSFLRCIA